VANIAARKAAHERLAALPPYPALISGRFDPQLWARDPERRSDIYEARPSKNGRQPEAAGAFVSGYPGSTGVAEGTVRLLRDSTEGHLFQEGEVLVAAMTNVGWTPLFPRAAAVVTDVGAPLSHAAIVARELGIPAVVGTGDATMRLQTGDRVRVDGARGVVEKLSG
jgi:rifampicin phosphotransferase